MLTRVGERVMTEPGRSGAEPGADRRFWQPAGLLVCVCGVSISQLAKLSMSHSEGNEWL